MGRIVVTGFVSFLYWKGLVPLPALLVAIAVELYPLVKTGLIDSVPTFAGTVLEDKVTVFKLASARSRLP